MKFTAKLVTDRELERPVQRFAPDKINAEGIAREALMAGCSPGDCFEIYETRQVLVSILTLMPDGTVDLICRVEPKTK